MDSINSFDSSPEVPADPICYWTATHREHMWRLIKEIPAGSGTFVCACGDTIATHEWFDNTLCPSVSSEGQMHKPGNVLYSGDYGSIATQCAYPDCKQDSTYMQFSPLDNILNGLLVDQVEVRSPTPAPDETDDQLLISPLRCSSTDREQSRASAVPATPDLQGESRRQSVDPGSADPPKCPPGCHTFRYDARYVARSQPNAFSATYTKLVTCETCSWSTWVAGGFERRLCGARMSEIAVGKQLMPHIARLSADQDSNEATTVHPGHELGDAWECVLCSERFRLLPLASPAETARFLNKSMRAAPDAWYVGSKKGGGSNASNA